jgi:uncharacterized protein YgiM (DUF1202 family)
MRPLLPLVLAVATACPSLAIAEETGSSTQEQAAAASWDTADLRGISVATASRANVRYGPNKNSHIAVTLKPGETVLIVGPSPVPGWYEIRFPEQGQAWVHRKNLQPMDGGKRWRVTSDGVHARSDSTLRGDIVADLTMGEILVDKANAKGDWVAVSIPSAVAYIHQSTISLPNDAAVQQQHQQSEQIQSVWVSAQVAYAKIWADLKEHPDHAVSVDWAPLLNQLDQVAKGHPEPAVQMNARRIYDAIQEVVKKTQGLADSGTPAPATGTTSAPATAGAAAATATDGTATTPADSHPGAIPAPAAGTAGVEAAPVDHPLSNTPAGLAVPPGQENAPPPVHGAGSDHQATAAPVASESFQVIGFISENTDYPKVNAKYEVMGKDTNVIAFLTVKPGLTINLGEYDWRWVGVVGTSQPLDQSLHGLHDAVPLIEVSDVKLVSR